MLFLPCFGRDPDPVIIIDNFDFPIPPDSGEGDAAHA